MDMLPLAATATAAGQPAPLPGGEAALIGLAMLIVVMVPFLWMVAEHFNVMAHEGAHALAAFALGFTLEAVVIKLHEGSTKFQVSTLTGLALRWILVAIVGYLGPSAFGLAAARLIATGHVVTVLWVAIVLLVLLLFLIARSIGLISVPLAILGLIWVTRYAHAGLEEFIIYAMTWLLLLSGVRSAIGHNIHAGDASLLAGKTHVPRHFWALIWMLGTLAALFIGGDWLISA